MQPFRHLLKKDTKFEMTEELNTAFQETKVRLIEEVKEGIYHYDMNKETCLSTDWSKVGMGFVLQQKHCKCPTSTLNCCENGWKTVQV